MRMYPNICNLHIDRGSRLEEVAVKVGKRQRTQAR